MRITIDILKHGEVAITAAAEREYRLRGLRIPVIENLGIIGDAYEALNLSDNSLVTLGGFPRLEMLQTLIICNNQLKRITPRLGAALPNLQNLILLNNQLNSVGDLEPLADIPSLIRVALVGNPVCKEPGYRHFVISKLPKLRTLDFLRVRKIERDEAELHYGKNENTEPKEFVPGEQPEESAQYTKMTEEQRERIRTALKNANSIEEVERLELLLQSGRIPKGRDLEAEIRGDTQQMDTS